VHDIQLKAQVGAMYDVFEHPYLGKATDEVQIDAEASDKAPKILDGSHQEKIENFRRDLMELKLKIKIFQGTTLQ